MPIILFTLTQANQRLNPYRQVGTINNAGLDYIIAHITSGDAAQEATNYIVANYTTYVTYPNQTIDPLSTKGFNVTVNQTDNLGGIDLNGGYSQYLQMVFDYLNSFPPTQGMNTLSQSNVIFNSGYTSQFTLDMNNLLDEILDSGLPQYQMALALLAISVLNSSYAYWQGVYGNTGTSGQTAWYTYITGSVSGVNDLNWRQIIQQNIKGALQGACAANCNNLDNIDGSLTIGGAAAGMAAAAQNVVLQTGVINSYAP